MTGLVVHALAIVALLDPRPARVVDYYPETWTWCAVDATSPDVDGWSFRGPIGRHEFAWLGGRLRWHLVRT